LQHEKSDLKKQHESHIADEDTVKKLVSDFICRPISGKELLFLKYGSYF